MVDVVAGDVVAGGAVVERDAVTDVVAGVVVRVAATDVVVEVSSPPLSLLFLRAIICRAPLDSRNVFAINCCHCDSWLDFAVAFIIF